MGEIRRLYVWIVQLAVAGGDLLTIDSEFVDVGEERVVLVLAGKGDDHRRDVGDERRVDQRRLDQLFVDFRQLLGRALTIEFRMKLPTYLAYDLGRVRR